MKSRSTTPARTRIHRSCLTALALGAVLAAHVNAHADSLLWNTPGGSWDTVNANWLNGVNPVTWNNATPDAAIFGATGVGTVSLTEPITASSITFNTNGYTIAGNTLTLGGASPAITNNADAVISSVLAGTAGFTKAGAAMLTLSNANTFTGGVTILNGTLKLANIGALNSNTPNAIVLGASGSVSPTLLITNLTMGNLGAVTVPAGVTNASIAMIQNSSTYSHTIAGATLGSPLNIKQSLNTGNNWNQITWSSKITGSGAGSGNDTLVFTNAGALQNYFTTGANATNDFSGNIHLQAGLIAVQNTAASANQVVPDASLLIIDAVNTGEWRWNTAGTVETLDGLAGAGKMGNPGNVTLTINASNPDNNGKRVFSGNLASTAGTLTKTGPGKQTFAGANITCANNTVISNGTLSLSNCTAWAGNVAMTSGTLELDSPAAWTLGKQVSGAGNVTKLGAGTMTLTAPQSFTGSTLINAGTLTLQGVSPYPTGFPNISGMTVWLDASDPNGDTNNIPANGASISNWVNKAGGSVGNFTNFGSGNLPTYTAASSAFNNKPVVTFTATGQQLANAYNFGSTVSVIYVGRIGATKKRLVGCPNQTANWLLGYWSGNMNCDYWGNGGNLSGAPDANAHIWIGAATSLVAHNYRFDTAGELNYDNRTGSTGPNGLCLGGGYLTELSDGDIAEMLVFSRELTTGERQQVEGYLYNKYFGSQFGIVSLQNGSPVSVASGANFGGGFASVGAVTVDANGGINGGVSGAGTLTVSNLTFSGAGTLTVSPSNSYVPLNVANALAVGGPVTVSILNPPAFNSTNHILQSANAPVGFGNFVLAATRIPYSLRTNGNFLDLVVGPNTGLIYPIWTGAFDSTWSTATIPSPKNWKLNTDNSPTDFLVADNVYFDDSATTTTPNISAANVSPGSTTFSNVTKPYVLSGAFGIANGSLTKKGSGLLTISNANSYAGGTILSNGAVEFVSGGLGSGAVTMAGNSTLRWLNGNTTAVPLALANGITATLDTSTNTVTETTALAGTGTVLTKTGTGTLGLGTAGTYSGGTTISRGNLQLNNVTAAGTGNITLGDVNTGANNVQLTLNHGNVTKCAYTVTVANQGSGTATIFGQSSISTLGDGASGAIILNKDVTLAMADNIGWFAYGGNMTGTGNVTWIASATPGDRIISYTARTYVGSNTVAVGRIQVQDPACFGDPSNPLTLSGTNVDLRLRSSLTIGALNGVGTGIWADNGPCIISLGNGGGSGSYAGRIYDSTGNAISLTKNGVGTQTLFATNTYTGVTTVNGGVLVIDTVGSLGNSAVTVASGAALGANGSLGGTVQSAGRIYGNGTIIGAVSMLSGGTLAPGTPTALGTLTLSNSLTDLNGSKTIIKISKDGGNAASDAVNFINNATVIYGGTLVVTNITTDSTPLLPTDIFHVFNPSNFVSLTYSNGFIVTPANLPTPPAGYSWDTSFLTVDGTLRFGNFVVPPVFSPAGGGYVGAQTVTITCATPSSTIHYTTDGWVTTNTYTGPIQLSASTSVTFQAYATAPSMTPSGPASASYVTEPVAVWVLTNSVFGLWSATNNWTNSIIPNNPNATADFSQLDLSVLGGDAQVGPDGSWTVGQMIFGDKGSNFNWSLGTGGTITLDASNTPVINVLNQTTTIDAFLAGNKGLTKTGNGTLVLDAANTYSGSTVISRGTLTLNNLTAASTDPITLGDTNTAANPVQLNLGYNVVNTITVSSNGTGPVTIDATYTAGQAGFPGTFTVSRPTTLSAASVDTFGFGKVTGSVGTFTLNGSTTAQGISFLNVQNDFAGTIVLASGHMTTWPGGIPSTTPIVVQTNAIYYLGDAQSDVTQIGTLSGNGSVGIRYQSGANSNPQTLSLGNGNGSADFGGTIMVNGAQTMSVIKVGTGTESFSSTNTYTGSTTVSNGTLRVNGALAGGGTVYVAPGGTLGGNGTIGGPVTVDGTLSPGASIGTLTISNALTLTGNVLIEVNKDLAQSNDVVNVTGGLAYGGTLTGVNIGTTPLVAGDSFQVFPAGGSGNVSLAGSPGAGLSWSFNPATGVLSVVGGVSTTPPHLTNSVSGGNLNLSWPADHLGWRLETQTNPRSIGLSNNWATVPGSTNVTSVSIPISPANPTVFYRLVYP
jgi:fibronectin-binding autotransporter adhesin